MYSKDGQPHIEIAVFKVHAAAAAPHHACYHTIENELASCLATHNYLQEHAMHLRYIHQIWAPDKETTARSLTH